MTATQGRAYEHLRHRPSVIDKLDQVTQFAEYQAATSIAKNASFDGSLSKQTRKDDLSEVTQNP